MTMKEKLEKMLATKQEQRNNLNKAIIDSDSKEERAALGDTLRSLAEEISNIETMLSEIDEPKEDDKKKEGRNVSILSTLQTRTEKDEKGSASLEYRAAFQKYMATGKMEYRADESTATTDTNISTVIPENLVTKILEKFEQLGVIYNLVTKTSFPVGQSIPVDGVKPVATWVGRNASTLSSSTSGEGGTSDSQQKTLGALITFAHYKLRCEIRYTEEVATMTLPAFEELFIRQVGEAMLRAQEWAVVEGDGYGMPTGILANTANAGQAITVSAADGLDYETLVKCEAAIPVEYESGTKWCMTKKNFMAFVGMVDQNGQPIARVNYGISGKPERTLLGREVVLYQPQSGSKMKNFSESASSGDIVAFLFDFADFVLNTNYNLGITHARDWDNEDHKTKAVLACDGKVIDKGSLVTLTVA